MDELYDKYYYILYHWALKKTNNKEDAEDLTNDIFVAIFSYFNKDIKIEKLDNLIWKIAHNIWNKKAIKYIEEKQNVSIHDNEIPNIENNLDKIIYKQVITEAFTLLTSKEYEAFNLYYNLDLSVKEISEKMNTTCSNIKYYLYSSRKKIKEKYYG